MMLEVRPLNLACNLSCRYCYQRQEREREKAVTTYDLPSILSHLKQANQPFTVFGGDPLLIRDQDLEELFAFGYSRYKRNVIQTNGVLLSDFHIRLFKKYNVHVGISIDGPGECNDLRQAPDGDSTPKTTAKSERAIERLCRAGVSTCLIVTLHRLNAAKEKIPIMCDWFCNLQKKRGESCPPTYLGD